MSRVRVGGPDAGGREGVRRGGEGIGCFSRGFGEIASCFSCVDTDIVKARRKIRSVGLCGLPGLREGRSGAGGKREKLLRLFPWVSGYQNILGLESASSPSSVVQLV